MHCIFQAVLTGLPGIEYPYMRMSCVVPFFLLVEEMYESVNDREIRQVFEGQNRIHLEIKQLHRQLAMILDEQRRYVTVVTDEIAKRGVHAQSGQVSPMAVHLAMHETAYVYLL